MVYEIEFAPPADDRAPPAAGPEAYLNGVIGEDMWIALDSGGVGTADALRILCPAAAVTRLKWYDIVDGHTRVVAETRLPSEELALRRAQYGGRFPWEVSG